MTDLDAKSWADQLFEAWRSVTPIPPLTDARPSLTEADAYEIQQELVTRHLAAGADVVGHKLGLTSQPMQEMLGVDTPDYGAILSAMVHPDGATIEARQFIAPRIEAEIAFVLDEPLQGPQVTADDVLRATVGVAAAIEIVDSRIADWRITLSDTIADLASCGGVVVSPEVVPIEDFDVRLLGMVLSRNGEVVSTGAGGAALGSPVDAVAWLANRLGQQGVALPAGQFVLTGALHRAVPIAAGDTFLAEFDRLGSLTVHVA